MIREKAERRKQMALTVLLEFICAAIGGMIGFVCAALCAAAGREDRRGVCADDIE